MYREKIIISGNYVEEYIYEKPVIEGKKENPLGRAGNASEFEKIKNRYKNQVRAAKNVRRLVNANDDILTKFLTLTYAENQTDTKKAKKDFKLFVQRLEYWLQTKLGYHNFKFEYVNVLEFQKRGAVHFHLACNLPYLKREQVKKLADVWGHGFVKLKRRNITNLGAYLSKYMAKDLGDERLRGEKCYMTSRGLKKPCEYKGKEAELVREALASEETSVPWEATFYNDHLGTIHYRQYTIKR